MADEKFAISVIVQQSVAKDFAKIEKEVEDLRNSILKLNTKLAKTDKELDKVKNNKAIQNQAQNANFFATQMGTAIKKLIAYRTVFLTLRGLKDIFKDTFDDVVRLDAVFADLNKVMGTTEENLLKLRRAGFEFAKTFGKPLSDVTAGFKIFAQQGLNTNQIIQRTQALMLAVSATTLTASQAVEALTAATMNFNISGTELIRVVDAWKAVESSAAVGAQDLANAMKQLAQVASVAGISLDFLNGIVAAVASVTRKSGQAIGTSFRTIFARLQTEQAVKAFQRLGVNVLNAEGALRPMESLLKDLSFEWNDLTDGQKRNFALIAGGKRRYSDFLALMNNFSQAVASAEESQNAFGEATIAAQINAAKLEARLNTIKVAWQELRVAVGEEAVKAFVDAAENIVPLLEVMGDNKQVIQDLIRTLGFLVGGLLALGVITSVIKWVVGLKAALLAAGVAATGLGATLAAIAPIAVALAAVGIAAFSLVDAYNQVSVALDDTVAQNEKYLETLREEKGLNEEVAKSLDKRATASQKVINQFEADAKVLAIRKKINDTLQRQAEIQDRIDEINASQPTGLGGFGFGTGGGATEITGTVEEVRGLRSEYDQLEKQYQEFNDTLAKIFKGMKDTADQTEEVKDQAAFALIELKKMASTIRILSQTDVLSQEFENARREAELMNKPFSQLKFELRQLTGIQKQFSSEIIRIQTKLAENNRKLAVESEKGRLAEDQARKIKEQNVILQAQLVNLTAAQADFNEKNLRAIKQAADALQTQKNLLAGKEFTLFVEGTGSRQIAEDARRELTILEAQLGSRKLTTQFIEKQTQLQIDALRAETQLKRNSIELARDLAKTEDDRFKEQNRLNKLNVEEEEKINNIRREGLTLLQLQSIELQNQVRDSIVSNLTQLPDFLSQRIEAEKLLEQERAQAEQRLAEARAANDAAAIDRAQADLDDIENRIRDLESIAGTVAEAFLKPFSDLFVERTMGQFVDALMSINQAGGATSLFGGIEDAGLDVANEMGEAITNSSDKGASKFESAITAGAQAGALLLGQVLGGGGKGAGIGAALGGAFGGLLGPAGAIGGALIGGVIGGLFDQDKRITGSKAQQLSDAIDKNTLAIENNNRLLELNREFINAPTRFEAPATTGSAFGIGDINVTVNAGSGGGASPADIGNGVADVIEKRLGSALRATGSKASKLGNR
jgi:TP901 family phage tail tape measure protein